MERLPRSTDVHPGTPRFGSPVWFLAPRWSDEALATLAEEVAVRVAGDARASRREAIVAALGQQVRQRIRSDVRWRYRRAALAAWRRWATDFAAGYPDIDAAVAAGLHRRHRPVRRPAELQTLLTDLACRWTEVAWRVPSGRPGVSPR